MGDYGAPSIADVDFTSTPSAVFGGQYQPGEVIELTLTADEPLIVGDHNPPKLVITGRRLPSARL